ncbi:MAG: hypothetical protein ACOYM2_17390 [Rectinemataceae bacterium]
MQQSDRWKRQVSETLKRLGAAPPARKADALRDLAAQGFRNLPPDFIAALFEGFAARLSLGKEAAADWLGAIGSILLMDYDDTPLSPDDWASLRDALRDASGELDLEVLTYAMALVVERGHL